ncbi:MAG: peptidoglycan bridge formation glycyltransferase FemA/FemB family protein [Treponema sp.]|nr:peptidoglycan bridge formation glycyltransferase FemA/FemB family protein [Treponema sp.]
MSGSDDAAEGAHASDSTNGGNDDAAEGAHASDGTGDGDNNRLTVLVRSFSLKIKQASLAYIPMAPELREGESHEAFLSRLCELANTIREFLPPNTMFVRYDCPIDFEEIEARERYIRDSRAIAKQFSLPLHVSPVAVQPPDTTILDLQKSEDEMLAAMKSKWRYNIRLAAKKGVQVACYHGGEADFAEKFDEFYRLFELTSERDGVSFHDKGYYLDLIERSRRLNEGAAQIGTRLAGQADEQDGDAQAGHNTARLPSTPLVSLYLASHEGDYLAGIITLFCPREAVYLYGASGNIKRNLMAAYLLQWTAIRDAKAYGCPEYDFYGMPPTDDEGHPMHGLYLFKTGFGGRLVHRPGSFDVPLKPASYRLYIQAEKARAFFFRKIVKKLKGR